MVGGQYDHGSRGIWNGPVNPKRKSRVNAPIEIDCHKTRKAARDKARALAEQPRNRKGRAVKIAQAKSKKPKKIKATSKSIDGAVARHRIQLSIRHYQRLADALRAEGFTEVEVQKGLKLQAIKDKQKARAAAVSDEAGAHMKPLKP